MTSQSSFKNWVIIDQLLAAAQRKELQSNIRLEETIAKETQLHGMSIVYLWIQHERKSESI